MLLRGREDPWQQRHFDLKGRGILDPEQLFATSSPASAQKVEIHDEARGRKEDQRESRKQIHQAARDAQGVATMDLLDQLMFFPAEWKAGIRVARFCHADSLTSFGIEHQLAGVITSGDDHALRHTAEIA
jgi:hypothetical protein